MNVWIILGIAVLIGIAVFAIYFMRDDVSEEWRKKINDALKWWSQTDEYLEARGKEHLKHLRDELDELLKYPETMFFEQARKIKSLRDRLQKVLNKKGGR